MGDAVALTALIKVVSDSHICFSEDSQNLSTTGADTFEKHFTRPKIHKMSFQDTSTSSSRGTKVSNFSRPLPPSQRLSPKTHKIRQPYTDTPQVTTDPRSNDYTNESTGPVASDSLAADSYRQGGGFSQNYESAPSGVSGSSSTWNNTDTSSASTLNSAPSASQRNDDDPETSRYPEAVGGQGSFSGKHNDGSGGYSGGPSGASSGSSYESRDSTGQYSKSGADSYGTDNGGTAPSYTLNQQGAFQGSKAKGDNLTEGGFAGQGTNYNSGIGTRDDPGRAAVQGFAKSNASATGPSAYGRASDEQPYGQLDRDERA